MKNSNIILTSVTTAFFITALPSVTVGQDKATPQEVVAKVREAASVLSKTGDVAQFNQKQSPWVWKDTYIFVLDCDKQAAGAHPLRADLIGQPLSSIKDARGKLLYPDPTAVCTAARKRSGVWMEYWWAKPGEKEGSRKISYHLGVKGTPYVVAAGIYDDKATIAELSKLTAAK